MGLSSGCLEEGTGEVFSWVGSEGRMVLPVFPLGVVGRLRGAEDGLILIFRRGGGEVVVWRGFHPPDCMTGLVNFG